MKPTELLIAGILRILEHAFKPQRSDIQNLKLGKIVGTMNTQSKPFIKRIKPTTSSSLVSIFSLRAFFECMKYDTWRPKALVQSQLNINKSSRFIFSLLKSDSRKLSVFLKYTMAKCSRDASIVCFSIEFSVVVNRNRFHTHVGC